MRLISTRISSNFVTYKPHPLSRVAVSLLKKFAEGPQMVRGGGDPFRFVKVMLVRRGLLKRREDGFTEVTPYGLETLKRLEAANGQKV